MNHKGRISKLEEAIAGLSNQPEVVDLSRAKENLARLARGEGMILSDEPTPPDGPWKRLLAAKLEAQVRGREGFANKESHNQ